MPQAMPSLRVSPSGLSLLSRPPVILLCSLQPALEQLDIPYLAFSFGLWLPEGRSRPPPSHTETASWEVWKCIFQALSSHPH